LSNPPSQSHNRYSYVWNNPATFVDPSGFQRDWGPETRPPCSISIDCEYVTPADQGWVEFEFWVGQVEFDNLGSRDQSGPSRPPHSDDNNGTDSSRPNDGDNGSGAGPGGDSGDAALTNLGSWSALEPRIASYSGCAGVTAPSGFECAFSITLDTGERYGIWGEAGGVPNGVPLDQLNLIQAIVRNETGFSVSPETLKAAEGAMILATIVSPVTRMLGGAAARLFGRFAARATARFGRSTVGAAERQIPRFTRQMKSQAQKIAEGRSINKVDILVEKFGGTTRGWKKMKTWTDDGAEIHYYEHHGIGRVGGKWAGFPDPF